jgi:hypothetical protein
VLAHHLGEVLGQGVDLLLQEKEGGFDGTQLPFVNNKGECLHPNLSAEIAVIEPNAPQGGMMANRHEGWDFPSRVP